MSVLAVRNVSKNFVQADNTFLPVIKDISLKLQSGEILGLLGASGSGKTTLLKMLAGLDKPDSGTIESPVARPGKKLGYLSQNDRLLSWRNALDNVALGLELIGESKKLARLQAMEALRKTGMEKFAFSMPSQLSGGMQQRVLLARTLVLQPELLLLDEPMSNVDILARQELAAIIKEYIQTSKASAILVTHSVEEACFLADRVLLVTSRPASIAQEIIISDNNTTHEEAFGIVMAGLLRALKGQHDQS
jgi:ABC-type nitrate/sulfonate/bicarbonate transport system ATPase subunit